jgi:hypothetical protein
MSRILVFSNQPAAESTATSIAGLGRGNSIRKSIRPALSELAWQGIS